MIRKFIFRNKLFIFAFFIFMANVLFSSCQKTQSSRTEVALGTVCTISLFENASDKLYDRIFEKIKQNIRNSLRLPGQQLKSSCLQRGLRQI